MQQTFALITNCSSSRTIEPIARVGKIPPNQTMKSALANWAEQLNVPEDKLTTPSELYRGMGFMTIAKIMEQYKPNDVKIVTGGQGLISLDEKIVPYDFTANKAEPENIWQAVTQEPFVQAVWWRMINDLRGKSATPIADYVKETNYDFYLISMGKVFLRYIAEDILSIPFADRPKIKILLAASSTGSVPAQLRPMIIPFDREVIAHLPGNRNDGNHRAAQYFLSLMEEDEEFANGTTEFQRQAFSSTAENIAPSKIDLATLFENRPHLLQLDMDTAFKAIRKEFGTFGGKMYFRSEWRKAKGLDISINPEDIDSAKNALSGLSFLQNVNTQTSNSEEDDVLKGIKTFLEALKIIAPHAVFNAANVCEWGKTFYTPLNPAPQAMTQPNKLAYILKNNADLLNIQETGIAGATSYTLKTQD